MFDNWLKSYVFKKWPTIKNKVLTPLTLHFFRLTMAAAQMLAKEILHLDPLSK